MTTPITEKLKCTIKSLAIMILWCIFLLNALGCKKKNHEQTIQSTKVPDSVNNSYGVILETKPARTDSINNPVLKGFNPDPSLLRVGEDYFMVTSTFQWWPGIAVYHSKDLVNWHFLNYALTRKEQLDLTGIPGNAGIYAPQISYHDGTFYLLYTIFRESGWPFPDADNYLVTTSDIRKGWSDPVLLHSSGIDPSLFHDDDGKTYIVYTQFDYLPREDQGNQQIYLQEFDLAHKKFIGEGKIIYIGSISEGPHLLKKDTYYHLITAEGGTRFDHYMNSSRAKNIWGPFEQSPYNPIITSRDKPKQLLQKAGHGNLIETQTGEWYVSHLAARTLPDKRKCPLGRESSIQKIKWTKDGWFQLSNGSNAPLEKVQAPDIEEVVYQNPERSMRDEFDGDTLQPFYLTLRTPFNDHWLSLKERSGYLRMRGRQSPLGKYETSILARKVQSFEYTAETAVEFEPENIMHMAGLTCYYDEHNFFYLNVSKHDSLGKVLSILHVDGPSWGRTLEGSPVSIEGLKKVCLKVKVEYSNLQFYYSRNGKDWIPIGPVLDASELSDLHNGKWGFTGAMVGILTTDMQFKSKTADYDYFEYLEQ
ncbi:family 43 glycosylhydrolase [Mariniflexile sp.]|uniref:family 43 glycosylhydrolase n=1 Tax=Mariniflexile sp. TaxID=1979402 RepID=UPI0040483D26